MSALSHDDNNFDFDKLERELNAAVLADEKYQRENDAKFRAVEQRVATYEEFKLVLVFKFPLSFYISALYSIIGHYYQFTSLLWFKRWYDMSWYTFWELILHNTLSSFHHSNSKCA